MEGLLLFAFSVWAILDTRIHDGIIGRHLLTFAAIFAAGYMYSGDTNSFLVSYVLALTALLWVTFSHYWKLATA